MADVPRDVQQHYEESIATLNSPGWRRVLADLKLQATSLADARYVENLDFTKGQLQVLDQIDGLLDAYELAYEQIKLRAAADEDDDV